MQDISNEELLKKYQETHDSDMRKELTLRYLYIIKSIALQMRNVYLGFSQVEDIVNEGVLVLMKALDTYDAGRNAKFETYVSRRIRGRIIDIARKQDWAPRTMRKSCKEIQEKMAEIYAATGQMPTNEEMGRALNMPMDKVKSVMGKMNLFSVLSLDMVMEETREKQQMAGLIPQDSSGQPEEQYLENEFRETLREGIKTLNEKEMTVISLYYVQELNMKEIAEVMQVSKPRISQIHANAIRKLKEYLEQ
ncbi:MAG: FliA/WhiG family RNA polymerase sigma factor [Lachnospiraceae bacterium]|nr:FliA/WhiG family RNA polymerase sigma factor [Lachnospiraceae bacterium]